MTNGNQTQNPGISLENLLGDIGTLTHLEGDITTQKDDPNTSYQLKELLAKELASRYNRFYQELAVSQGQQRPARQFTERQFSAGFTGNTENAVRYANQASNRIQQIAKPLYDQNKDVIIKQVIDSMQDSIKDKVDGDEVSRIVAQYLKGIIKPRALTQSQANEYARKDFEQGTGIEDFVSEGDIEQYKPHHADLQTRLFASQYIKPLKADPVNKEKITGYEVDSDKVKELMKEVLPAGVVYTNYKGVEYQKAQQRAQQNP